MKIAMFTNTYLPHVGGVANSIRNLEDECRDLGHEVRIIAPAYEDEEVMPNVMRVPAIRHFHGSDFSVRLPLPMIIRDFMDDFRPDIIHSHHPFLLGDAALREAWKMRIPILFTHHTLYESYTHYVPLDSAALKRAVIQLTTEYCNLCDLVVAPSESLAAILKERKVLSDIVVTPTGIDTASFASGDREEFRRRHGIRPGLNVIGHVGRLTKEKNLHYLAGAVALCLRERPDVLLLLAGEGDSAMDLLDVCPKGQVIYTGVLSGNDLFDVYAAMDCFVFSSQSETQGMVLAEAMAAGLPVVALDGPGVRDIVETGQNGFLLPANSPESEFAGAVIALLHDCSLLERMKSCALKTAARYERTLCVGEMVKHYERLIESYRSARPDAMPGWERILNGFEIEWELLAAKMSAAAAAMVEAPATEVRLD
jgi:1,2-diacylglycerol 3-alpha-glucosyltransferase